MSDTKYKQRYFFRDRKKSVPLPAPFLNFLPPHLKFLPPPFSYCPLSQFLGPPPQSISSPSYLRSSEGEDEEWLLGVGVTSSEEIVVSGAPIQERGRGRGRGRRREQSKDKVTYGIEWDPGDQYPSMHATDGMSRDK